MKDLLAIILVVVILVVAGGFILLLYLFAKIIWLIILTIMAIFMVISLFTMIRDHL